MFQPIGKASVPLREHEGMPGVSLVDENVRGGI
jgi:hypothetical protein